MELSHVFKTKILYTKEEETEESKHKRKVKSAVAGVVGGIAGGFNSGTAMGRDVGMVGLSSAQGNYDYMNNRDIRTVVTFLVVYFDLSKETVKAVEGTKEYDFLVQYISDTQEDGEPYIAALKSRIKQLTSGSYLSLEDCKYFSSLALKNGLKEEVGSLSKAFQNNDFNAAVALKNSGKYDEAIAKFKALPDDPDSAKQIDDCLEEEYKQASELKANKKYDEAISAFTHLADYKDSKAQVEECKQLRTEYIKSEIDLWL